MIPWAWLSYTLPFTRAVKVEHEETKGIHDHTHIQVRHLVSVTGFCNLPWKAVTAEPKMKVSALSLGL